MATSSQIQTENIPNGIRYRSESAEGFWEMSAYELFPGISLAFNKIRATAIPGGEVVESTGHLTINYCLDGICELLSESGRFVYLQGGDLSISNEASTSGFSYPSGAYDGLELFFSELGPESADLAATWSALFGVDPGEIERRYCADGTFVTDAVKPAEEELRRLAEAARTGDLYRMRILCASLLRSLTEGALQVPQKRVRAFTPLQVRIAKEAEALLTEDLSRHLPVREVADRFSVSETSLKNYFRGVYGMNISEYRNRCRMEKAATLLRETRLSVLEISRAVGYQNQGRFAARFKQYSGATPLNFRREQTLK